MIFWFLSTKFSEFFLTLCPTTAIMSVIVHLMEVKVINKQKFLAELGRLLTFMYEEDRQDALAMYSKMFDDAVDEQSLLQFLVSPTRQAVVLARSYDAKERKLQVHTQSREQDYDYDGQLPPFILAISDLQQDAAARGIFSPLEETLVVDEDQISLFDSLSQDNAGGQEAPQADYEAPAEPADSAEAPGPDEEAGTESDSVAEFADAVDAFLADFSITDGELVPNTAGTEEAEPLPAAGEALEPVEEAPQQEGMVLPLVTDLLDEEAPAEAEEAPAAVVRQPKVFLLILFCLLAIPVTLLGVLVLLAPTLLCLCLAVGVVSMGVLVLTAAFGGFAIFADLMVILGLAIVLLAVGLLFTWLFIWFIGGAIVGLIRGVCHLGGKWCYKEVAVQ